MGSSPGDARAWLIGVLAEYERPLLRYARSLTRCDATARDVVQETFLRLCRQPREAVDGHVGPWLFRVCRQRALDEARRDGRLAALSPNDKEHAMAPIAEAESAIAGAARPRGASPAEQLETLESLAGVARQVATLPGNQQEVVRLRFEHELSYREISEVTGLSVSNVGFLLHSALRRLRAALRDGDGEANRDGGVASNTGRATRTLGVEP